MELNVSIQNVKNLANTALQRGLYSTIQDSILMHDSIVAIEVEISSLKAENASLNEKLEAPAE